jgi:HrpA-like RNA helicase
VNFYFFFFRELGKSTQIPQFLLDDNPECRICVTQPRRISAISIAERVAEEQCQASVGGLVGYQVRLESAMSQDTQLLFMTPGILLRKMHSSNQLNEFTHIIIDEIHERDRFQEFLLVVLRDLLPVRPDLRVVLMSATLQSKELVEYFSKHGLQPAVIEMEGRTFAVQEYFLEQVLAMTGYIDPTSTYDVGVRLEAEMAKVTGQKLIQYKVANVSLKCAMCGQQGFTDPLALGEHIALCDGGWLESFDDDIASVGGGTKGNLDILDGNFKKFVDVYGDFDLSDVRAEENSEKSAEAVRSSSQNGTSRLIDTVAAHDSASLLPAVSSADTVLKSGINSVKKSALRFEEIDTSSTTASVVVTPKEQTLLTKYQTMHNDEEIDNNLLLQLVRYIAKMPNGDGGILVFLPGWYEISTFAQTLEATAQFSDRGKYLILPLHSGIASKDQRRVMQPAPRGTRKIVLATNIAETSVTINDIVYVIDTGRSKEKNYDPHLKTSTLQLTWVSQASAKQRKGRAGRVKPGICFHLFSRTRHESLRLFTESELLRTPLVCAMKKTHLY